jgi:hypothetical protein
VDIYVLFYTPWWEYDIYSFFLFKMGNFRNICTFWQKDEIVRTLVKILTSIRASQIQGNQYLNKDISTCERIYPFRLSYKM